MMKMCNEMKGNIAILLIGFLVFLGCGESVAQKVIFVETADVQKAMESYKTEFQKYDLVPGYRVQYLFTNDRREMERTEREFRTEYERVPTEWEHDPPYYKLFAGSFLSRTNAMRLLVRLRENFPGTLLVHSSVSVKDVYSCRKTMQEW